MRRWFSSGINPVVQAFGRRPEGRIGIAKAVELPKALADIINGIGLHIGQGGALKFIPRPEDNPGQAADRLQVRADYNILANFAHLVQDAKSAGHIRTGSTSSQELGTAWWVISGRKSEDPSEVAAVAESVRIDSAFPEFTPSDALLCAIVERQNTGLEDNTDILLKWTFGEVENVPSIRVAYNIQACPDLTEAVYASVDRSLIYKDQSGSSYFPYNSTPVESGVAATIGTPTLSGILEAGPSHEPDATGVPTDSAIPESENPLQEPVTFKPTTTGPTKPMAESTKDAEVERHIIPVEYCRPAGLDKNIDALKYRRVVDIAHLVTESRTLEGHECEKNRNCHFSLQREIIRGFKSILIFACEYCDQE
ncbi:unnamed protein product [Bemisia tabaci]|uniref:Uncharacterized protein n=1 Tax=Bemisia tabaci TaxID=7038 RepID=A0A9P0AH36_BEMTA|nr:unnamed protein product [Bemisia tabaci]